MQRRTIAIAILILFLFGGFDSGFCQTIYVPTTDAINKEIFELLAGGYLEGLSRTERPYLVSDIVKSIMDDKETFDPERRKTAQEILSYLEPPQKKLSERLFADFNAGIKLRGLSREQREGYFCRRGRFIGRDFKNEFGSIFKAGWWISKDSRWGIDTRILFDSDGTGYPWYYGTPHNARTIGQFDHAYALFDIGYFDILAGRTRMIWGPSPRGSLLIDDGSPPMDMIRFRFKLQPFILSWFASRLDDYYDPIEGEWNRRYLSGHRLMLKPGGGWEIAASEVVLYGGPGRLPELHYNIPVLLFYWEAQNRKVDDNTFWALDLSWTGKGIGRFYTQFVADDIQYEGNGPQKFALQVGAHLIPSRLKNWSGLLEVAFVDTYVYGQRQRRNAYLNWGSTIGRLDSDQLELFAGLYRKLNSNIKLGFEYIHREKGEFDARDFLADDLPVNEKFPSGIVETINDFRAISNWRKLKKLDLRCVAGYQKIGDYQHTSGDAIAQFYAHMQISYAFDLGLPFWTKYH